MVRQLIRLLCATFPVVAAAQGEAHWGVDRKSCTAKPSSVAWSGKFKPAPTPRRLFALESHLQPDQGDDTSFNLVVESEGQIESKEGLEDGLALYVTGSDFGPGVSTGGSLLRRYAARKGAVRQLTNLEVSVGPGEHPWDPELLARAEAQLRSTYQASAVTRSDAWIEGLEKPACQLPANKKLAPEGWTWNGLDQQGVTPIAGGSFWAGKNPADPEVYVPTSDHFVFAYVPERALHVEQGGLKYDCFVGPGKRENRSEAERHNLATSLKRDDLQPLAVSPDGTQVFALKNPASDAAAFDGLYGAYKEGQSIAASHEVIVPALTREQFIAKRPFLYRLDGVGRIYRCAANSLVPDISRWVEPLLYFYSSTGEPLDVALGPDVRLWASDPAQERGGWTLTADAAGHLLVNGQIHANSVFWEGRGERFPEPPVSGVALREDEVPGFLAEVLPRLGLRGREIDDFTRYWEPRLRQHPGVLVDFFVGDEVELYVPLVLSRPVQQRIRLYLNYRPLRPDELVNPPERKTFAPVSREIGEAIVEWGGVHWGTGG